MGNFTFGVPALGNKFVDYRQQIPGDSFNWAWTRPLAQVKYLVIHHTAAVDTQTPESIANYHINNNGWGGIGYHLVISKEGVVYYVGDLTTARANVKDMNHLVVGICLVGNFTGGRVPTDSQIGSTRLLCEKLLFNTPELSGADGWEDVVGHKQLGATACPGDNWESWRQKVVAGVPVGGGGGEAKRLAVEALNKIAEAYAKVNEITRL